MGKTKTVRSHLNNNIALLLLAAVTVSSCVPSATKNVRGRASASATTGSSNVAVTEGRVLADNPIILSGKADLSLSTDLNKYASTAVITSNTFLQSNPNCYGLTYCFQVKEYKLASSSLQTPDGKWGYKAATEEFLQVNSFYHMNKIYDQFLGNLGISIGETYSGPTTPLYATAIPYQIYNSATSQFGLSGKVLNIYSNCDEENNASYNKTDEEICLGYSGSEKQLRWAHDSTIIYHEAGHYFQKLQLNLRNVRTEQMAQMGNNLYSEAGSIGEGLSDFFSYYVNGRTHWGEWAAGKLGGSRPLSESDTIHVAGISADEDQRLSYPQYLTYDPNRSEAPLEDIHVSGMILSHYLVALSQDLQTKCSLSAKDSREYVMYILNETMAELGDLTSTGTGATPTYPASGTPLAGKVNMDLDNAITWHTTNNPINYRSFAQTIAKNLLNSIGNPGLLRCGGSYYSRDNIESLLDSYGLLLFKTYNQHRNHTSASKVNTAVTSTNRKKSVLISKSNLILDPTTGASAAYVIDNRAQIKAGLESLTTAGIITTKKTLINNPDLDYNNGNSKVSPGEVVAIALNLYNNSNSTMGGIQVLANDWDHAETTAGATFGRPCRFDATMSNDQWPLESEGASVSSDCATIGTTAAEFAPVCFVQSNESSATKWISQKEFKTKLALDSNYCLDKSNDKDCFIRAIKGADQANFSKINPKSTWLQTMANPVTKEPYDLSWGNVILFEVSKHIPPGTILDCRLRLRFTNCEDCYHDSTRNNNDFFDKEYNGPRPFKTIHLQIPVTD